MVRETDQPYVFTNDNPLSVTDPLGDRAKPTTQLFESSYAVESGKVVLIVLKNVTSSVMVAVEGSGATGTLEVNGKTTSFTASAIPKLIATIPEPKQVPVEVGGQNVKAGTVSILIYIDPAPPESGIEPEKPEPEPEPDPEPIEDVSYGVPQYSTIGFQWSGYGGKNLAY